MYSEKTKTLFNSFGPDKGFGSQKSEPSLKAASDFRRLPCGKEVQI